MTVSELFIVSAGMFQFQTGSIRSDLHKAGVDSTICFNSKLVRLEEKSVQSVVRVSRFQFQTGSIRSQSMDGVKIESSAVFQFQTGSIRRRYG